MRILKKGSDPLEVKVIVFREDKGKREKLLELVTLIEDLEWEKED
jgi:hypothetical protein